MALIVQRAMSGAVWAKGRGRGADGANRAFAVKERSAAKVPLAAQGRMVLWAHFFADTYYW